MSLSTILNPNEIIAPKNYIENFNSEIGTTGWATYADAAGVAPVDGTGNINSPTPVAVTLTATTSSPLRGATSFLITKDAVNRQGQGISYNFSIEAADQGKVLQGYIDYQIASGTFADNDLSIWIYDVTNAVMIQPTPYLIKNSTIIERMPFEFQAAINSTSYRLIVHVASTSAVAYTFKFDNVNVGQQGKLYGSPITDWVSYTPTITTASGTMTGATASGRWRRVGDSAHIQFRIVANGSSGTWASPSVSLPTGMIIDNAKSLGSLNALLGNVVFNNTADNSYLNGKCYAFSPSTIVIAYSTNANGAATAVNQASPFTFDSTDSIEGNVIIPIQGWSSSQLLSNDADTRVIAAIYNGTPTGTLANGANNTAIYPTKVQDTHGAYNTSTGVFTAPVSGFYEVTATACILGTVTINSSFCALSVGINGTTPFASTTTYVDHTGEVEAIVSKMVYLNSGQTIQILTNLGGFTTPTFSPTIRNYLSIQRISGPAQIAASESVSALYTGAPPTGSIGSAENLITFGTKVKDSHSAYNTSTGEYTIPVSGVYSISAAFRAVTTITTAGQIISVEGLVDGVVKFQGVINSNATLTTSFQPQLNVHAYPLLAGQKVSFKSFVQGTSPTFTSDATANFFSIVRTGNY